MNNTRKILLGLSLLGTTTLVGFSAPVFADERRENRREERKEERQELKEDRKNVKEARKKLRDADSRDEKRDAREDLREEKRDLRYEKRDNGRPGRPNYSRPVYGAPAYNRPTYTRPGYSNAFRTLQGVVTNDTRGNDFLLRTSNGQIVRVVAVQGESRRINRGDAVRVSGRYSGSSFKANSVSIVRNR